MQLYLNRITSISVISVGKNRTAQVVKPFDGVWGIDLERTTGPEAIWRNKQGMRESWRKNYEWLVENAEILYEEN